ncbi:MAG: tryptophan-rich sensory protein [Myxococcales bacterium]|nr:tryptophan-rich sensory protein [Myxococcales bacterium]
MIQRDEDGNRHEGDRQGDSDERTLHAAEPSNALRGKPFRRSNALWSLLFFGLQRPGRALAEIGTLLGLVVATAVVLRRIRPLAGWLFVPYAAWLGFAAYLNAGIGYLNA